MKKRLLLILIPTILILLTALAMDNTRDKQWFTGSVMINSSLEDVNTSLSNLGEHYLQLIGAYPGMTTVELLESGKDYVIIKTNEGRMKRTDITVTSNTDSVTVNFDEEYITAKLTTNAHFVEKFIRKNDNIELSIVISDHKAPGFLGFFLRNFGSKNIGNGFLDGYKKILEK